MNGWLGSNKRQKGNQGEELAIAYLKANGYRVLERNLRTRYGEIDLVAQDGKVLCFVEIKTRSSVRFGWPEEGVGYQKQWRLSRLANGYLQRYRWKSPVRFDVVSLMMEEGQRPARMRLIKGAFEV